MPDEPRDDELQAPRAWKVLVAQLGVHTPRALGDVKALTRQIRATPKAKRPRKAGG